MNGGVGYVVAFVAASSLSLVLTPLAIRLALRWSILDRPSPGKAHVSATPYLGGVAIAVSFLLAVAIAAGVDPPGQRSGELATVLIVALALTVLGLVDDLRHVPIGVRLAVEVAGALAVWTFGEGVQLFGEPILDATITVLWIVGVVNAVNLLDHHDGLSAGVAVIAAGWFFLIAALEDQHLVGALAVGLAGCGLGFLRSNFPPARIFMGDAGSLFLGFMLAVIGLKLSFPDNDRAVTFLTPIFVVGAALFDTALVVVSRTASRRSPMRGGLDHTAHRLARLGLPGRAVSLVVYVTAIASGWVGLIISRSNREVAYLLAGLVVFVALVSGAVLLAVPVEGAPARFPRLRRALDWPAPE